VFVHRKSDVPSLIGDSNPAKSVNSSSMFSTLIVWGDRTAFGGTGLREARVSARFPPGHTNPWKFGDLLSIRFSSSEDSILQPNEA